MGFAKMGSRGGFGSLGALGRAGTGGLTPARIPAGARLLTGGVAFVANPGSATQSPINQRMTLVNNTGTTLDKWQVTNSLWKQRNVSSFSVWRIAIDNGGSGYTTATASIVGGSGSGATLGTVITGGVITAIYVTATGTGWLDGETPTVSISGDGSGATAHVSLMDTEGEEDYPYGGTFAASIEYPSGTYTQFLFSSASSIAIAAGGEATSDALTCPVPNGAMYWLKWFETLYTAPTLAKVVTGGVITGITITNGGSGLLAPSYTLALGTGSGGAVTVYTYNGAVVFANITAGGTGYSAGAPLLNTNLNRQLGQAITGLDGSNVLTANGTLTSIAIANATTRGPSLLTAIPSSYVKGAVVIGDSIATGFQGGETNGDYLGGYGWPARAGNRLGIGMGKITAPGYYASTFVLRHTKQMALLAKAGTKNVIVALGVNDITRGDTFLTVQANLQSLFNTLAAAGYRVIGVTIGPSASSSDLFATIVNQTPSAGFGPSSICQQINDWIRSLPSPLSAFIDYERAVGTGINTSLWSVVPTMSNGVTTGGVPALHPADVGHAMLIGRTDALSRSAAGSGYVSAPTLSFSNMGIPIATAVFAGGVLQSITPVEDGNRVYEIAPLIQIRALGGVGSGATATAVLTAGKITSYTVTAGGTLYSSGALVAIGGALPPQGSCTLTGDGIGAVSLDFPGSDLRIAPTVTLSGGGGSGGAINATLFQAVTASLFV